MKPTCYVMVGLPGLGKSYRANQIAEMDKNAFVYSTDHVIELKAKEEGKTYSEVFKDTIVDATKLMNDWLNVAITSRLDVIWDQTNLGRKKREDIVQRMKNCGYNVVCECYCHPQPSMIDGNIEWSNRLKNRPGKIIPNDVMKNMIERMEYPSLDEGFDQITFFNMHGKEIRKDGNFY